MVLNEKYSKWQYILFPAIAMTLGWGLRGHIGGGPMGAMIPGAMVALTICMLLNIPRNVSALVVVFGVVGVGMGGEMTYGQTLSFLRSPDTLWWGVIATTVKGGVWGILAGIILALGFLVRKLSKRTILIAMVVMLAGMFLGFKLINEPMLIYFSDRAKPRSESWAALLFGAIALLVYLKQKVDNKDFNIVAQFAKWGLIGGALGFGLGGLWMFMGSQMPKGLIFGAYWKAMEFTFGLLLGGFLGLAAWKNKKQLKELTANSETDTYSFKTSYKELALAFGVGIVIFWLVSFGLSPLEDFFESNTNYFVKLLGTFLMLFGNYGFYGLVMIAAALYYPKVAWQIGISLTFCHTVIDLGRDHIVKVVESAPELVSFISIVVSTLIVGVFVAYIQTKEKILRPMFLVLTWSTVLLSTYKIIYYPTKMQPSGSLAEIIFGLFVVDIAFIVFAVWATYLAVKKVDNC